MCFSAIPSLCLSQSCSWGVSVLTHLRTVTKSYGISCRFMLVWILALWLTKLPGAVLWKTRSSQIITNLSLISVLCQWRPNSSITKFCWFSLKGAVDCQSIRTWFYRYFVPSVPWEHSWFCNRFCWKEYEGLLCVCIFYYLQVLIHLSTNVISVLHRKFGQMFCSLYVRITLSCQI